MFASHSAHLNVLSSSPTGERMHKEPRVEEHVEQVARARREALASWGAWYPSGEDVLAPVIGAQLSGLPPWPTREGFRALIGKRARSS